MINKGISFGGEAEKNLFDRAKNEESKKRLLRTVSNESKSILTDLLELKSTTNQEYLAHVTTLHSIDNLIQHGYKARKVALSIYNVVLKDWMYSFGKDYSRADFKLLFNNISDLVVKDLPMRFFLPAFPCKSSNKETKVLGDAPDFSEFLALQLLVNTARKIEAIYPNGVIITIMSDFHTFDQYIGVSEEQYKIYHNGLKAMIRDVGADDVIELISLSTFPEFKDVAEQEISKVLSERYGGSNYLKNFDAVKEVGDVLEKYVKMKKFMLGDQSHNLPGSPRANRTKKFIKEIARGMMSQGVALDQFLKSQTFLTNFIRLSIHNHHPRSGKFAIDLFKEQSCSLGILRTPWHHAVVFDTKTGEFLIDQKASIVALENKNSVLVRATFQGKGWFYVRLYMSDDHATDNKKTQLKAEMIRGGCGIIITNQSPTPVGTTKTSIKSDCISVQSMTMLIKQFGLVVLRGFEEFQDENAMIRFYSKRADNGILPWQFGPVHKVTPNDDMPGYVNSYGGIPIHFDMVAPPRYMAISQSKHFYEDFVCREFLLYCKENASDGNGGATTFVDAIGAVLSLPGPKKEEWKKTMMSYETKLKMVESDKEVYFGGSGNVYEYPLVQKCPWTGKDVLRWWESWSENEHPESTQHNWSSIQSSPLEKKPSVDDLEQEVKKISLDKRFFFSHSYQQGDQVFVNNYTTLHGREGFSSKRELWRIQAIPPSDNLPAYFKK